MEDRKHKQMIRRMFEDGLSGLQTDPQLAQRVLHITRQKEEKALEQRRGSPLKILAAALAFALVFAATAFALSRPDVLNWLLGSSPASTQLESAAQPVIGQNAAGGVTVKVTSVVFDGEKLAFSYEIRNDRPDMPVLVAAKPTVLIDGQEARMLYCTADPYSPQMVPSPHLDVLPVRRNPAVGGGLISIGEACGDKVTCEMTFVVYQPENRFAVVFWPESMQANAEAYSGDARAEAEDSLNTLKSFRNLIFAQEEDLSDEQWLAEGYTVIDGSGGLRDLTENSHLKELAQIKAAFTFDASAAVSCDFSGMQEIALDDCTLRVERFRLSTLETAFDVWFVPEENTKEAAAALTEKYGAYVLTDENGLPVEYSAMDYLASGPYVTQINGQWICRYLTEMPGLLRFPESIGFEVSGRELFRVELMGGE